MSLFVVPFTTLIPVYAREIYHGDATTFGMIDSVIGGGALAGAIYLATLHKGVNLKRVLFFGILIFGASLLLFAWNSNYYAGLVISLAGGFGMMTQITTCNTLLQILSDKSMRGRVVSYFAMAFFGMQPIGGLLVGFVSQHLGVPITVFTEGCIALCIALVFRRHTDINKSIHQ